MPSLTQIDALEPRRLFALAQLDNSFGAGGVAQVESSPNFHPLVLETQVVPIADGRIVVASNHLVSYLRGDGTLDPKRAGGRVKNITFDNHIVRAVAVDPRDGRVAALRYAVPSDLPNSGLVVDLYDPKGKRVGSRTVRGGHVLSAALNFAPDGTLFVASSRDPADRTVDYAYRADVIRYDGRLVPFTTSFGSTGTANVAIAKPITYDRGERVAVLAVHADALGRVYLVTRRYAYDQSEAGVVDESGTQLVETQRITRLTARGVLDTSYGNGGSVTVVGVNNNAPTDDTYSRRALQQTRVDAAGRFYGLYQSSTAFLATTVVTEVMRLSADGTQTQRVDVGERTESRTRPAAVQENASFAVAPDGSTVVATGRQATVASVYRLRASDLAPDDAWTGDAEGAVTTFRHRAEEVAVAADGRVLLGGPLAFAAGATFSVVAIAGATDSVAQTPARSARLLADGTLLVNGSSRADAIEVRTRRGRYVVTINGRTSTFDAARVDGLLVRGGNGDDRVTLGSAVGSARVEAAAGDDTIDAGAVTDAEAGVTLLGGSGADTLTGGAGRDRIEGGDGDDLLVGRSGADELVAGAGDDRLYAVDLSTVPVDDGASDFLDAGDGRDTLWGYVSIHVATDRVAWDLAEDVLHA